MTNWLEEKEKELEEIELCCDDCLCCRDIEYCSIDRQIEIKQAEIEAYKRGVADTEEKYKNAVIIKFKEEQEVYILHNRVIRKCTMTGDWCVKDKVLFYKVCDKFYQEHFRREEYIYLTEAQAELERLKNENN